MGRASFQELVSRLKDPRASLGGVGAIHVATSQKAFRLRRLGEFRWASRYPNQGEPFVNFAAALSDLNRGRFVRARRFDRQPVLQDTGQLFRSISFRIQGSFIVRTGVLTGPARRYANLHHQGGKSKQTITAVAKETLAKQIKKSKGKQEAALRKLGLIVFNQETLVTKVNRRPIVGITPESEEKIRKLLVEFFEGGF